MSKHLSTEELVKRTQEQYREIKRLTRERNYAQDMNGVLKLRAERAESELADEIGRAKRNCREADKRTGLVLKTKCPARGGVQVLRLPPE